MGLEVNKQTQTSWEELGTPAQTGRSERVAAACLILLWWVRMEADTPPGDDTRHAPAPTTTLGMDASDAATTQPPVAQDKPNATLAPTVPPKRNHDLLIWVDETAHPCRLRERLDATTQLRRRAL